MPPELSGRHQLSTKQVSANFEFLALYSPQLTRLGGLAERYFKDDPNTCLIKLRQFGEVLAQLTAAKAGLFTSPDEQQTDLLRRLKFERIIPNEVADLFRQISALRQPTDAHRHRHPCRGAYGCCPQKFRSAPVGNHLTSRNV